MWTSFWLFMYGESKSKHAPIWNGLLPHQCPALYAKVWLFLLTLLFKTVKNFSVKSVKFFLFNFWTFFNQCMFWFWLSADEQSKRNLHIEFLAKWLSHSFDRMILRKKRSGEGGLVALQFFGYLERQLELLIFNERFY